MEHEKEANGLRIVLISLLFVRSQRSFRKRNPLSSHANLMLVNLLHPPIDRARDKYFLLSLNDLWYNKCTKFMGTTRGILSVPCPLHLIAALFTKCPSLFLTLLHLLLGFTSYPFDLRSPCISWILSSSPPTFGYAISNSISIPHVSSFKNKYVSKDQLKACANGGIRSCDMNLKEMGRKSDSGLFKWKDGKAPFFRLLIQPHWMMNLVLLKTRKTWFKRFLLTMYKGSLFFDME